MKNLVVGWMLVSHMPWLPIIEKAIILFVYPDFINNC